MTNLQRLHKGDFNDMEQVRQPDGSVIITLLRRKGNKYSKFRVKDLYGPNEQEVDLATGKAIN